MHCFSSGLSCKPWVQLQRNVPGTSTHWPSLPQMSGDLIHSLMSTDTDKHTDIHTHTDKQADKHTDKQTTDRQTYTHRETNIQTGVYINTLSFFTTDVWRPYTLTDVYRHRQPYRHTDKHKDRLTDRQTDRQAGRQTGVYINTLSLYKTDVGWAYTLTYIYTETRQTYRQTDRQRDIPRLVNVDRTPKLNPRITLGFPVISKQLFRGLTRVNKSGHK